MVSPIQYEPFQLVSLHLASTLRTRDTRLPPKTKAISKLRRTMTTPPPTVSPPWVCTWDQANDTWLFSNMMTGERTFTYNAEIMNSGSRGEWSSEGSTILLTLNRCALANLHQVLATKSLETELTTAFSDRFLRPLRPSNKLPIMLRTVPVPLSKRLILTRTTPRMQPRV